MLAQYENEPPNASQRMVKIDEVVTDFEQGRLVHTDRPLDTMILGDGFYAVETPDGERYTRITLTIWRLDRIKPVAENHCIQRSVGVN